MNIKYARGWTLAPASMSHKLASLPEYFVSEKINKFYVFSHDARLECRVRKSDSVAVIFIGIAYDIERASLDMSAICQSLCEQYGSGETPAKQFLGTLDNLAGRFAVLVVREDKCDIFNDCSGLQSVFYRKGGDVAASHYGIVNIFHPGQIVNDYRQWAEAHAKSRLPHPVALPGDLTPYEDIFVLSPNCSLSLPGSGIRRYFPLERMEPVDIRDASEFLASKLKLVAERLNRDFKIYASLTSGMDSRTTLSASRDIKKDILFFTYHFSGVHKNSFLKRDSENNLAFSRRAAKDLGLDLVSLDLSNYIPDETVSRRFAENHYLRHNLPEVLAYADLFKANNPVHLRSNAYEIIKSNLYNIPPAATKRRIAAFLTNYTYIYKTSPLYGRVFDYYLSYIDKYDIMELLDTGYNFGDLFYMEHRNAQWLAACLAETDAATPTFTPINCRKLIKTALSVPKQARDRDILQTKIIDYNWPELLDNFKYPNNPQEISRLADYEMYRDRQVFPISDHKKGKTNFTVKSFNPTDSRRRDFHYLKSNFDDIIFGFSSPSLVAEDTIALYIVFRARRRRPYYLSFCVYTGDFPYLSDGDVAYNIYINSARKYSASLNEFAGLNKFDCLFPLAERDSIDLRISLVSRKTLVSQFVNSLVKISGIIFRETKENPADEVFVSSLDALREKTPIARSEPGRLARMTNLFRRFGFLKK